MLVYENSHLAILGTSASKSTWQCIHPTPTYLRHQCCYHWTVNGTKNTALVSHHACGREIEKLEENRDKIHSGKWCSVTRAHKDHPLKRCWRPSASRKLGQFFMPCLDEALRRSNRGSCGLTISCNAGGYSHACLAHSPVSCPVFPTIPRTTESITASFESHARILLLGKDLSLFDLPSPCRLFPWPSIPIIPSVYAVRTGFTEGRRPVPSGAGMHTRKTAASLAAVIRTNVCMQQAEQPDSIASLPDRPTVCYC